MPRKLALGVDVGGTKIAAGVVDSAGAILHPVRAPMAADGTAAEGLQAVKDAIEAVLAQSATPRDALAGIGLGSPGPLDPARGIVVSPRNLPCWRNFPLAEEIERAFGLPARLDNDANAAGLAEALWGAAAGYRNALYVTIGTGIGTAIVLDQRIFHGRTGNAGEGGHVSINYQGPLCGCGKRGCVEIYCAGPAIALRAQARLAEAAAPSLVRELAGGKLEDVDAKMVGEAFDRGDALATQVMEEVVDLFSVWLGNMIDVLDPDVIVAGGGVTKTYSKLFGRIREQVTRWTINPRSSEIPLLPAKYGADSGIAGAAALVLCGTG